MQQDPIEAERKRLEFMNSKPDEDEMLRRMRLPCPGPNICAEPTSEPDYSPADEGWKLLGRQCQQGRYWYLWEKEEGEEIWFRMIPLV